MRTQLRSGRGLPPPRGRGAGGHQPHGAPRHAPSHRKRDGGARARAGRATLRGARGQRAGRRYFMRCFPLSFYCIFRCKFRCNFRYILLIFAHCSEPSSPHTSLCTPQAFLCPSRHSRAQRSTACLRPVHFKFSWGRADSARGGGACTVANGSRRRSLQAAGRRARL